MDVLYAFIKSGATSLDRAFHLVKLGNDMLTEVRQRLTQQVHGRGAGPSIWSGRTRGCSCAPTINSRSGHGTRSTSCSRPMTLPGKWGRLVGQRTAPGPCGPPALVPTRSQLKTGCRFWSSELRSRRRSGSGKTLTTNCEDPGTQARIALLTGLVNLSVTWLGRCDGEHLDQWRILGCI
jgi:hypothetical protein